MSSATGHLGSVSAVQERHSYCFSSTCTPTHTASSWFTMHTPETTLGRPRSLEPAVILALADTVSRVCSRLCCWRVGRTLERAPGNSWCRLPLLHSQVPPIHVRARAHVQETQGRVKRTLREMCQQKVEWTLADAGTTDRSRIVNIDETCCKMLPLLERGWLARGEQHVVIDNAPHNHRVPRHRASHARSTHVQGKSSAVEPVNICHRC